MEEFRIFNQNRGVESSIFCHFFKKLFYSLESLSFHLFFTFFEKLTMENFQFLTKIVDLPLWGRSTILTYRDLIDNHVNDESLIPSTDVIQLTLNLKMTTAQVVERSVTVNKNSPIQDKVYPEDHTQPTYEMVPGFKLFTKHLLDSIVF